MTLQIEQPNLTYVLSLSIWHSSCISIAVNEDNLRCATPIQPLLHALQGG